MIPYRIPSKLGELTHVLNNCVRFQSSSPGDTPSLNYCIDLVRKLDHENYLCTLLLPDPVRTTAFAIRAFNIELSRIQDQTTQRETGLLKGKFWEECIDQVYRETPPKHPVLDQIYKATQRHKLSKFHFKKLLTSRLNQLNVSTFKDMDDMESYADKTCTPILMLLLEALNVRNIDCDHVASHVGKAQGLCNLIRSLPYNLKEKLVLLPRTALMKHNISEESLIRNTVDPETLSHIIFEVATKANNHIKMASSLKDKIPRECYPLFLPAVPVRLFLKKLEKTNFHIYDHSLYGKNGFLPFTIYWHNLTKSY
ncbi:hypothetical protein RUM43_008585 [Polyplax serrata]|uniref:NADH dehydrogenase (Ubiquinone) complex I, assembly factor 6 n=1 Tax=Polyplax serrata TaxID=468196 RepID=A0AAN8S837_POLSC